MRRFALAALLLLAGCWSREAPLVTLAEAVQPVPSGNYGEFAVTARPDKSYSVMPSKPGDDDKPLTCLAKPLEQQFHILQCAGGEPGEYVFLLARVSPGDKVTLHGAGDDGYADWLKTHHPDLDAPSSGQMARIQALTGSDEDDTAILAGYARHLAGSPPPADKTLFRSDE